MRDCIRFFLNGIATEVAGDDAFLSLSEYLRGRRGLTGTKVVCAEGDCGSCSVLIGRAEGDGVQYRAVTSCIQMMFQLDAAHIVTVEGLKDGTGLNPIQQTMVAYHGTQCGFCTPGFVVALQGLIDDGGAVNAEQIRRGLTGNLCRCTGYGSIIKAAMATDRTKLKSVDQLFPPGLMLAKLHEWEADEVDIQAGNRRCYKPVTIEQTVAYRKAHPDCSVISGCTDLGVVHNKRIRPIETAMLLGGIRTLTTVRVEADAMQVGAGATLATLESLAQKHLPELAQFMQWFGSPLIRNAGTIGGNLVTGSPIGDTIPALTVLEAEIEITGTSGIRHVNIKDFYTGYRKTVLASDELVTSVRIPLVGKDEVFKLFKVSRRKDLDISSFSAAIWMKIGGGIISEVRIAMGGVGPMVLRLKKTEQFLRGKAAALELFETAGEIAIAEVTPINDVRGSAEYRRTLAGNILVKFWHEADAEHAHLGNGQVSKR